MPLFLCSYCRICYSSLSTQPGKYSNFILPRFVKSNRKQHIFYHIVKTMRSPNDHRIISKHLFQNIIADSEQVQIEKEVKKYPHIDPKYKQIKTLIRTRIFKQVVIADTGIGNQRYTFINPQQVLEFFKTLVEQTVQDDKKSISNDDQFYE